MYGQPVDGVELLHADRHAAERQVHVGACRGPLGVVAVEVAERVQVARADRVVRRRQLLDRRTLTTAERLHE